MKKERHRQADDISGVLAEVGAGGDGQGGRENIELEGRYAGGM